MKFIKKLLQFALTLAFKLGLWAAVYYGLMLAHSHGTEQHYPNHQPNQEIASRFHIWVENKQGENYPIYFSKWQENPDEFQIFQSDKTVIYTTTDHYYELTPIAPDVFELYVDLDTVTFTQRYRITPDNRVEPISFREIANPFSFMILFFLSLPILGMVLFLLKKIVARLGKRAVR